MDGEIIDKEVEPKKFNWWYLFIDGIISSLISIVLIFGMLQLQFWYYSLSQSVSNSPPKYMGLPFGFLEYGIFLFNVSFIDIIEIFPFILNFIFYFVIVFFFLRYKNIKFSKHNQ